MSKRMNPFCIDLSLDVLTYCPAVCSRRTTLALVHIAIFEVSICRPSPYQDCQALSCRSPHLEFHLERLFRCRDDGLQGSASRLVITARGKMRVGLLVRWFL